MLRALSPLLIIVAMLITTPCAGLDDAAPSPVLERQLLGEDPARLAHTARNVGDPVRGALLFHQAYLACVKCHGGGGENTGLGPDLTTRDPSVTDVTTVESILQPSKAIKQGFEPITVVTDEGVTLGGLLVEQTADRLVLRDASQDGKLITLDRGKIAEQGRSGVSIMPAGLANQLRNRQEFLDLVGYLIEVREQGAQRARELRPADALLAPPPLPEYEQRLDHAGMVAELDQRSFKRGESIYSRLCANCHGTQDEPGSLPTSLRFASGQFKNGNDPFSIYQTLTKGFGMMAPQTWMVPQQKYDVIHYIREAYLKPHNPQQYVRIERRYLDRLPQGSTRGPEPTVIEPWVDMDYGPNLIATYEIGSDESSFAYKGIAVRLDAGAGGVARGKSWMVFEHDTLNMQAGWSGQGFIDWNGINFNGRHNVHPRLAGQIQFANPSGPAWANPRTGSFDDPRLRGRDGRPYGPLPRDWAHYRGLYHHENRVILAYTVGEASVLESPGLETNLAEQHVPVFTRTMDIGRCTRDLQLRVAPENNAVALVGRGAELRRDKGFTLLQIRANSTPLNFKLLISNGDPRALLAYAETSPPASDLEPLTRGGPKRWPEILKTPQILGRDDGPFAVDVLTHPDMNPWQCQLRLTGLDFLPDGDHMAVCTWDGDVWLVRGIGQPEGELSWQRIASGLFQPLGLKIVDGQMFVSCRDQIVILRDLNGDGETDFYENFNSDHQVTEHFHEFAMGLQTDAAGNFYYAKSARHAKTALVPHHGTLLQVSRDGLRTKIVATGFRAANGVCVNPDGTFIVTDQEGHWNPKNRINWVTAGGFYGNIWGYHDVTDTSDSAMQPPVCWITNSFDRSPGELLWAGSPAWGPLQGSLLNFSYGYGKIFIVPHERVDGQVQGGMCELPIQQSPTGLMRGRFHPQDGQLYTCGMFAWAGNQQQPGGLYRVRYTGKPVYLPTGLHARRNGMSLTFTGPLDYASATDVRNYAVKVWSLKRTEQYGSDHYGEHSLRVASATLSQDGRTVLIEMPEIEPTWCMETRYTVRAADGQPVDGVIHNTVHRLGE